MTALALSMQSPASQKRSYDEAGLGNDFSSAPTMGESYIPHPFQSLDAANQQNAHNDPIPSVEITNPTNTSITPSLALPPTMEKPAKKVKLSSEEKEAKRLEKEAKDRVKAEEKARKEEEKARKDEEKVKRDAEKAVKDEERRKLKEAKEEQTRLKDEEKQKKEEEKMKKARSQLRLNAFFQQPTSSASNGEGSPNKSPAKPMEPSPLSSRRSSIAEINAIEIQQRSRSASVQATPSKQRPSDYKKHFPDFFVQSNTVVAPQNRFCRDEECFQHAMGKLEELLSRQDHQLETSTRTISDIMHLPPRGRQRRYEPVSLKDIIRKMNGSSNDPIDLTTTSNKVNTTIRSKDIPLKFLKFAEDVRPPYIGTYSKHPKHGSLYALAKNPFSRVRPDTNYDWDSEAEWEDVVDGEDCESEGEEDEEDEDEDEMAGFLDDEGTNAVKRRPLLGNLEPECSGICWAGQSISSNGKAPPDLSSYRIDILLENSSLPIDPFSTTYWTPKPPPPPNPSTRPPSMQQTRMEPPRIPLSPVNRANALLQPTAPPTSAPGTNKPPKRHVDPEVMDDFKKAIEEGSNLTKMGLCEILKVKFPKQKKDAIKDTLEAVAERVGAKVTEKKWVLRGTV